ncbi:hypothetical protein RJ639_044695 [Escallonia herrerae]|uniref:Uncharacterized protein n=1 Tax=Escallonia herrerae TaxID=1293975 RepID=A0AA89B8D4_9ASTE|nr:hypothetical protein RJ639_044695 [Escallonia herrerae]
MASETIFNSTLSEHHWTDQISKDFDKEYALYVTNIPVSVFNVPKSISAIKPEAYIPQVIALGPYHHLRSELYQMERYKVAAVKSFLNKEQVLNFQNLVIDKLKTLEPIIRACYHKYMDIDGDTLAWIIGIDGLFLLDILGNYDIVIINSEGRKLSQDALLSRDVMVLENQIPTILLKELRKTLQIVSAEKDDDDGLISMLEGFCRAHSPLGLAPLAQLQPGTNCLHLLDLMYLLIVNHEGAKSVPQEASVKLDVAEDDQELGIMRDELKNNLVEISTVLTSLGIKTPLQVITKMPWEKISNLLGIQTGNKDKNPLVEEIKIPSVSHLRKFGGIRFSPTNGGIRDARFVATEATLYLPVITLNANSEVVLRNLVAYEAATSKSALELGQYVDLMSGILDTDEDTRLLVENKIIQGELSNDNIAQLFNGMNKTSGKARNRTIEEVNAYFNSRPRVQAYNFIKQRSMYIRRCQGPIRKYTGFLFPPKKEANSMHAYYILAKLIKMASETIFNSTLSEHRWTDQIRKDFDKEYALYVTNIPVSVFNVPKSISAIKPEAYIPQVIALGPYHHLRSELYQMERYKVAAVKSFLNKEQVLNFQNLVIDKLKTLEPIIRACYHKYMDIDGDTLAWIIGIDGLFLLDILGNYDIVIINSEGRKLSQDALLSRDVTVLENQIPTILLKELRKTLQIVSAEKDDDDGLISMLEGFCRAHSPLGLAPLAQLQPGTNCLHLLDLMYLLIVNHVGAKSVPQEASVKLDVAEDDQELGIMKDELKNNLVEISTVLTNLGIKTPLQVITKMPWEKISNLLGIQTGNKDKNPLVEEIKIPSVSRLRKFGGIRFSPTNGGIRDAGFVTKEATLYLPVITLNANSEVVLRNLVAYETATSKSALELGQYVDLMSGILDTAEDARLLVENKIIQGELSNDNIAQLFNGMNKTSGKARNRTIEEVNAYFNSRPRVQAYNFIKQRVYASWRALTLISTIVLVLLLILQSFCQVYGCPRLFGRSI